MRTNPLTGAIIYEDYVPSAEPPLKKPIEQECFPGDARCYNGVSQVCNAQGLWVTGGSACGTTVQNTVITLTKPTTDPIVQGSSVYIEGTLKTTAGTPVANKSVSIWAVGADYENRWTVASVTTDSQGRFSYTIPGTHYTAISLDQYDKAQAGAIFFGDSAYHDSEAHVSFLVISGEPCPDGIDAEYCYADMGCELGTEYCENGILLECQQKKDCTTCYVQKGTCKHRTYMKCDSQSHTQIRRDQGMFAFTFEWYTDEMVHPCREITFGYRPRGSSVAWIPLQHTQLTPDCLVWGLFGENYDLEFDAIDFTVGEFEFKARFEGSDDMLPCETVVYLKILPEENPPVCVEGNFYSPQTCWDGSTIYTEKCVNQTLVPSGQVCPTHVCNEGEFDQTKLCGDGVTTIYEKVCEDNAWVASGQQCPPVCSEGESGEPFTCWDGSTIYKKVCQDNAWANSGQVCPPTPCTDGAIKCDNGIEYICSGNQWVPTGEACSSGMNRNLIIAAGAIGIGIVAVALLVKQ
jgi:hypothetical protein